MYHTLQIIFFNYKSRLAADEDDNGRFRFEVIFSLDRHNIVPQIIDLTLIYCYICYKYCNKLTRFIFSVLLKFQIIMCTVYYGKTIFALTCLKQVINY